MPPGSFFSQYPEFDHDPTAPLVREFQRLSLQRGWKADGKKYRQSRQNCFAQEFEYHYGQASNKLAGWQTLCEDVYISPIPSSINQCKKVGRSSHHGDRPLTARGNPQALSHVAVNLVDLIDSRRTGKRVKLFPSKAALRNYSIQQRKIFPKHKAKADGFLSALLIEIF